MPSALMPQKVASGTSAGNSVLTVTIAADSKARTHVHGWHSHFQDGTSGLICTLTVTIGGSAVAMKHRIGTGAETKFSGVDIVADPNTAVTWSVPAGGVGKVSEAWVVYSREEV